MADPPIYLLWGQEWPFAWVLPVLVVALLCLVAATIWWL